MLLSTKVVTLKSKRLSCLYQKYVKYFRATIILIYGGYCIGCATATQKYAIDTVEEIAQNPHKGVGEVTEHVVDMRENTYIFLDERLASFADKVAEEINSIYAADILTYYLHYKKSQELARIWEKDNPMRESLEMTYKASFERSLYDCPRAAFYFWTNFKIATSSFTPKQGWIYLGSNVFGKNIISDVTEEDMKSYMIKVTSHPLWRVRLKYLGTAEVNWPPGWGSISYFDLIDMKPVN